MNELNPKLRVIDAVRITYEGMRYLMLRDPYRLSESNVFVPEPVIPLLGLMDGQRSPAALRGALALRYGLMLTSARLDEFIAALDDAYLLDNARSQASMRDALEAFHAQPFRPPSSAGSAYPADPAALAASLQDYLEQCPPPATNHGGPARGLVSPHIDYERGGPVYAQVWGRCAESAREATLAVIFGTDHYSEGFPFSLTRQHYATPFGVLPTHTATVDALASAVYPRDPQAAFRGELHHRHEHSIELAAVWLHYMRGGQPIDLVPVLTGPLDPGGDSLQARALLKTLRAEIERRAARGEKTLVVAAGDLAHLGPAFDSPPVDAARLLQLKDADDALIDAVCRLDSAGFLHEIEHTQDANNVCGVSPIYLTLRLLESDGGSGGTASGAAVGERCGYAVCPADEDQTSVVSVCGVALRG